MSSADAANVGPDLDSNCLTLRMYIFLQEFFEKGDFEKNQQTTKRREKFPRGQELITMLITAIHIYLEACRRNKCCNLHGLSPGGYSDIFIHT